jgi:DNA polymerase (family X)
MAKLEASAVATLLVEIGQRLVLAGENPYKARAYSRAAQNLLTLTLPLGEVIAAGRLREIPGVGEALAATIEQLYARGATPKLEALRADAPAGVLEMLRIPGLSPQKVRQIHKTLGINNLADLESACRDGRVRTSKGLGPALETKISNGIELLRRSGGQRLIYHAGQLLEAAEFNLRRSHPELTRIALAGDYRRGCELVSELAIVAQTPGDGKTRVIDLNGEIRLWLADQKRYGAALLFATGSREHLRELQEIASANGLILTGAGLLRGRRSLPTETEEQVYGTLNLSFIPPELREGRGEVALARAGRLPKLLGERDLHGLLHCHTDFSDGGNTLKQMAEATRKRGYQYFGVADHSQSAGYAGGLSIDEVEEQHALADELNASYRGKFRILKGIESDILQDGSLDYPDEMLDFFDFVVSSVHSRFRLDANTQTDRIIRAVSNPFTTILGHLTGRMLLRRPGYEVDIDAILRACAEYGVAVEINANPHRLDVDWRWHGRALELGCMFSINPDAHSIGELDLTRWGVLIARKGGIPPERVLNSLNLKEITTFLHARRAARSPDRRPRLRQTPTKSASGA